jgi:beta-N-acetylhexosaminidase
LKQSDAVTRRTVVGGLALAGAATAATRAWAAAGEPSLADDVGEMLMLGFTGDTAGSTSAKVVARHLASRRVGSVVFRKMNVRGREEVTDLVRFLSPAGATPLIAIDHEGGFVQRLVGDGYTRLPPALEVAKTRTPDEARDLYIQAAAELALTGFNVNLAPVVDLQDADNPAIGHFGRAFDANPAKVADYAGAFIDAFAAAGVHCALKHFPGEGHAHDDSHEALPDITATWSEKELEPYVKLIATGQARIIMNGNVRLTSLEPTEVPTTLSAAVTTGLLRNKLGFKGVIMTDDLDMASVREIAGRRDAVIRAIAAGNDLLMVCNTDDVDPELPQHVVDWVGDAIVKGVFTRARVAEAAARVRNLKRTAT